MRKGISVSLPEDKPYLTTGHRVYMIGGQDGLFPEHGEHLPYEMWGIWAPPIKLWNGFWIKINGELMEKATVFEQLPYAAKFLYENKNIEVERFQFVPQEIPGFILKVKLKNLSEKIEKYNLTLGMHSNLMPVWLAERAGITDGFDFAEYMDEDNSILFTDEKNTWYSGMKASEKIISFEETAPLPVMQRVNNKTCYCEGTMEVKLHKKEEKTVCFFFASSLESQEKVSLLLKDMEEIHEELLEEKIQRYEELSKQASLSYKKQPVLEEMYGWTQYINDWIIREVPGLGKGVVAGYPEFPWWFGNDTNYIVPALLLQGEDEICKETLRLVRNKSIEVNNDGRVVHEVSSNGVVYYEGMTTETPQFADTVWQIYNYTGDYEFLKEMYEFCLKGMQWIEKMSPGGLPVGYGISEIAGLDCMCCDTAMLMIRGYEVLGFMAEELGNITTAKYYKDKFITLWKQVQNEFYITELGVFGDMVATKEEIIPRAEAWQYTLQSFPISDEEKIMGESSCKKDKSPENAEAKDKLRLCMQKIIVDAKKMSDGDRKAFYLFGLGHSVIPLEFGYIKGKEAKAILSAMEILSQKENLQIEKMMPIGLGRKIKAYGSAKEPQKILEAIQEVAAGFSEIMPGATNEIYPNAGCFVQGWNSLVTMWPYADTIFGIKPKAKNKKIFLEPCICEGMDGIYIENMIIGKEKFNFRLSMNSTSQKIEVDCPDTGWDIKIIDTDIELIVHKC